MMKVSLTIKYKLQISPVCEPQSCSACSNAFCKLKLESICFAFRLSDDIAHTSELQMSVVKPALSVFSKLFKIEPANFYHFFHDIRQAGST